MFRAIVVGIISVIGEMFSLCRNIYLESGAGLVGPDPDDSSFC